MAIPQLCDHGTGSTSYLIDFVIMIPMVTFFQIALFVHFLLHWKDVTKSKASLMSSLFTVLQIAIFILDISVIIKGVGSKQYEGLISNQFFCNYTSFIGRILLPFSYVILITLLIFKLKLSFKGSIVEINKTTQYILFGILYISIPTLMTIYLITSKPGCIYEYYAWDINQYIYLCTDYYVGGIPEYCAYSIYLILFSYNLLLGFLFVYKLHKVLKPMTQNANEMEMLIIKHTILTVATASSSLITYILWTLDVGHVIFIIHLDALFNCIMIALMYNYNHKYFTCICGLCVGSCQKLYSLSPKRLSSIQSNSEQTKETEI